MAGHTQVVLRQELQGDISEGLSYGEGVLAGGDRAVIVPHPRERAAQIGGGPPQPRLVVENLGEGFRLLEVAEHLAEVSEVRERISQAEPEVDSLLLGGAA